MKCVMQSDEETKRGKIFSEGTNEVSGMLKDNLKKLTITFLKLGSSHFVPWRH